MISRRAALAVPLLAVFAGPAPTQDRAPSEAARPLGRPAAPLTATERAARLGKIRDGLRGTLADLDARLARPNSTVSFRDLTNGALATLIVSGDAAKAESILRRALAVQKRDPNDPAFGDVPWQIGPTDVKDANAIEFGMQAVGPMLLVYGNQLSPEGKRALTDFAKAGFAALRRHDVKVGYTNIFLMKATSLIVSGEAVGDADAARDGYALLDQWLATARETGIREFGSPTYYGVAMNSLGLGYRFASRKDGFKAALDRFWSDIAANYFPGRSSLSGPHSRDYDFLRGTGGLSLTLYVEGLRDYNSVEKPDLEKAFLPLNLADSGYRPDPALLAAINRPERVSTLRWDAAPEAVRTNYITPDFAIGSTNKNYGPQDKMVNIELTSTKDLPTISIVPDALDNPYGRVKIKGRDGHSKPVHLPLNPVTTQNKGELFVTLGVDARRANETESLATNVILPARADSITVDGKRFDASTIGEMPVRVGGVVGVREGNAGVAIRILSVDGAGGQSPTVVLKTDENGLPLGAARLAAYHYRGPSRTLPDPSVRVAFWIVAARCATDAEFASLIQRVAETAVKGK